jgi:cytochrome c oxidase subunit 2
MSATRRLSFSGSMLAGTALAVTTRGAATSHLTTPGDEATSNLFLIVLIPALAIGVLVQLLLILVIARYRRRRGHEKPPANPKTHDAKLEAVWTVAPAVILAVVGLVTFQALQVTDTIPDDPDVVVRVVGQQWFWSFSAEDRNGTITNSSGEFTVRQGDVVKLVIESIDVAHSLWIPDFQLKVDALPGRVNVFWFQALEPGDYRILCAEFCGVGHPFMVGTLHVVSP